LFIKDLYYRIAVLRISVPALRERIDDIEPTAEHFLKMVIASERLGRKVFRPGTIRLMESYIWPGNLRELRNSVSRMAILSKSEIIEPIDFVNYLADEDKESKVSNGPTTLHKHKAYLAIKETEYFQEVLRQSESQLDAAKISGLPRSTFNNRIRKLNIDPNQYLKEVRK
jgi:DNA-binding NtrC family response regulator